MDPEILKYVIAVAIVLATVGTVFAGANPIAGITLLIAVNMFYFPLLDRNSVYKQVSESSEYGRFVAEAYRSCIGGFGASAAKCDLETLSLSESLHGNEYKSRAQSALSDLHSKLDKI